MVIFVQQTDFSLTAEYEKLTESGDNGAIVTFVGRVRSFSARDNNFFLQHYPGMTEKALKKIELAANKRWALNKTTIIHRVGNFAIGEQIVFVGIAAAHRSEAFAACEFIIDTLKTEAPFWKKEGDTWVEAKESDNQAADRWIETGQASEQK